MFEVNDYVFYGSCGVCRVDRICEEPTPEAVKGVLYYVLTTLTEPKQTILNPVANERVFMRYVMTKEECEAFFDVLPTLPTLTGGNAKVLREQYIGAMKSSLPNTWGQVMRTFRARLHLAEAKLVRVTDAERNFYEAARRNLGAEISLALGISQREAEERLHHTLD